MTVKPHAAKVCEDVNKVYIVNFVYMKAKLNFTRNYSLILDILKRQHFTFRNVAESSSPLDVRG